MQKKRHLPLFFLFIVSVLLMTYQNNKGPIRPFGFLRGALNPVDSAIHSAVAAVKEEAGKISARDKDLKKLKAEAESLRFEAQRLGHLQPENKRLKGLLLMKESRGGPATAAKVIGRGSDKWSNTFVIDKGSESGIKKDMAVITANGLAGKITEVYDSYSLVLLINDMKFSASVRLSESRHEAVASGTGGSNIVLKYVPQEQEVKKGDTVITSGLDLLFPPNINVGVVSGISKKGEGLFQHIEVSPFVNTRKVEEVLVLNPPALISNATIFGR